MVQRHIFPLSSPLSPRWCVSMALACSTARHARPGICTMAAGRLWVRLSLFGGSVGLGAYASTATHFVSRITIGYHRLYSHRAFRANLGVRIVLTALGSSGFQGSIKVRWSLYHRFRASSDVDATNGSGGACFSLALVRQPLLSCNLLRCLRHRLHHVSRFVEVGVYVRLTLGNFSEVYR